MYFEMLITSFPSHEIWRTSLDYLSEHDNQQQAKAHHTSLFYHREQSSSSQKHYTKSIKRLKTLVLHLDTEPHEDFISRNWRLRCNITFYLLCWERTAQLNWIKRSRQLQEEYRRHHWGEAFFLLNKQIVVTYTSTLYFLSLLSSASRCYIWNTIKADPSSPDIRNSKWSADAHQEGAYVQV